MTKTCTMLILYRLGGGCSDGVSCDYAHSPEELQEWGERRDFLRKKLAKAKEDMFIMPDELDFGKYNFLLLEWWEHFFPITGNKNPFRMHAFSLISKYRAHTLNILLHP